MGAAVVPIVRDWRLNERHYGALQGLDKRETVARHGAERTHLWRRSYDVPPPPVEASSPEHPANDPRYADVPRELLPATECLRDVVARVVPCVEELVVPQLRAGRTVLVTAHGNSLRALAMHLEGMGPGEVAEFNVPTGVPRRYRLRPGGPGGGLAVDGVEYLGDAEAVAAAAEAVRRQTGGA
jgi:2,3-bisphosphoglycerate-dependent phosphoglycerate mutase